MLKAPAPYLEPMVGWCFDVIRHPAYDWIRLRAGHEHLGGGPVVEIILGEDQAPFFEAA
jgi:hypothetical protein